MNHRDGLTDPLMYGIFYHLPAETIIFASFAPSPGLLRAAHKQGNMCDAIVATELHYLGVRWAVLTAVT